MKTQDCSSTSEVQQSQELASKITQPRRDHGASQRSSPRYADEWNAHTRLTHDQSTEQVLVNNTQTRTASVSRQSH